MDGRTPRGGQVAIAVSALGYGVSTALSVVALHGLRAADLQAIERTGSAAVLLCRGPSDPSPPSPHDLPTADPVTTTR